MVMTKSDQVFFCIVGTLLAMGVVVYQSDYYDARAAMVETHTDSMGYRVTPASGDPYAYIRSGHYAKILAHEAVLQREAASGTLVGPAPYALNLIAPRAAVKTGAQGTKGSKAKQGQQAVQHAAAAHVQPPTAVSGPTHLNVAGVQWANVQEPSMVRGMWQAPEKVAEQQ